MAFHLTNVFETIMYEYAKLIADRAVEARSGVEAASRLEKTYWIFVARTFKKLRAGNINASSILKENKLLVQQSDRCTYCGVDGSLQWEHIIPVSRGGPQTIDNLVLSCPACNRAKAARNPIEWYAQRDMDRKHIPRLVMGKLLKLTLERHRERGSLLDSEFPTGAGLHLHNMVLVFDLPQE